MPITVTAARAAVSTSSRANTSRRRRPGSAYEVGMNSASGGQQPDLSNKNNESSLHCKRGPNKVSFDSQHDKFASQLSCDASPETYLSLMVTVARICHFVNEM
jgi:hypothetical protein